MRDALLEKARLADLAAVGSLSSPLQDE